MPGIKNIGQALEEQRRVGLVVVDAHGVPVRPASGITGHMIGPVRPLLSRAGIREQGGAVLAGVVLAAGVLAVLVVLLGLTLTAAR